MLEFFQEYRTVIEIISIPIMCGFVGWMTNVVALKMTFYPLKFWGIPPYIGWQGIIPRKAPKMAGKSTEMLTERLIRLEDLVDNVESEVMSRQMTPVMEEMTEELVEKIGNDTNKDVWKVVPDIVKRQLITQTASGLKPVLEKIMHDIKFRVLKAFDVKSHVMKSLTGHNVKLLVEIFQKVGAPEFKFIENCGWYFGASLGMIQAGIWHFYSEGWTLIFIGAFVGWATNWLAIKMIFRPLREKDFGLFKYQGLFLRWQDAVSKGYANMIATRVLSPRKILNSILFGKDSDITFAVVNDNMKEAISKFDNVSSPFANLIIGKERYDTIKDFALERVHQSIPRSIRRIEDYLGQSMDLENVLYEKMRDLEPEEFETILRTAFQEDEWILIAVGAALGALVGAFQAFSLLGSK